MTELLIRIDQETGAILGVQQKEGEKVIDLESAGDLFSDKREKALELREWRDTFNRHISVPLELWEIKGNTICSVRIGGRVYKCRHR